ncbi:ATP synthase epsilon chain [Candidatus Kinetoplastibacterium sorsogonicusi]|uniref:ATP synthase epsilon chain n=1 Tax=Candidatus Kinetoplastidibacterium kentomonadis TaxID=1576550 RepID=A0A3Q8EWN8_9PROT|nr:F0F1 ATP synthase subunit epsilon [Candidatus Kinetoplastibacterium sorsogonicusi]AWD32201.1 ATP synthase epsilon chain [Candidatus Kinetoplastibacterium sorsogonicusi]
MSSIKIDIVSSMEEIFSGNAKFISVPGVNGHIGILPGHAPLISLIRQGYIKIVLLDNTEEHILIAGGILEVQKYYVTVLTDTAIRANNYDEASAAIAREKARISLLNAKHKTTIAAIESELAMLSNQAKFNIKRKNIIK